MARYEWIIMELGVVALLVWELFSVRRAIRRDKAEKAKPASPGLPPHERDG